MNDLYQKTQSFRETKTPIVGNWEIGDETVYGSLIWVNGKPELTLTIDSSRKSLGSEISIEPVLRLTKAPMQPDIIGTTSQFGIITLESCFRINEHCQNQTLYTLVFLPTAVWIGTVPKHNNLEISLAQGIDNRLNGFFGNDQIEEHWCVENKFTREFEKFGNPEKIWALHASKDPKYKLEGTDFSIAFGIGASSSWSATEGKTFKTNNIVSFTSDTNKCFENYSTVVFEFNQLLSIFSLEHFLFQTVIYFTPEGGSVALCWFSGEKRQSFNAPMQHQIMLDFKDPLEIAAVCKKWFQMDRELCLSVRLFYKAMAENDSGGLGMFLTVTQAFETLGRTFPSNSSITKLQRKHAVAKIEEALKNEFDPEFVSRITGLVSSSNTSSFRDMIKTMILSVTPEARETDIIIIDRLSIEFSDARNAMTHMSDSKRMTLEAAFSKINKLSLAMSFWYAMILASKMGIKPKKPDDFLFNNPTARHGLPNEILEKLSGN